MEYIMGIRGFESSTLGAAKMCPTIWLGLGLLLGRAGLAQAGLDFAAISNGSLTGANPNVSASADLNGDGKADLVTANSYDNTVSVMLGKGNGTFRAKVDYSVGSSTYGIVVADLNGDGKPDLAATGNLWDGSHLDNKVFVLIGNGNGTFRAYSSYSVQCSYKVVATDLNGDGYADLATTCGSGSYSNGYGVSVLLNNGGGVFSNQYNYAKQSSGYYQSITVADFNGDGQADIATGIAYGNIPSISILLGNGDGSLQSPKNYLGPSPYNPTDIIAADLNGDARPDLAVASDSARVSVLLDYSAVGFLSGGNYSTGGPSDGIVATDLDGDGKLDLATANFYGDNAVSVLLGNGDGTFKPNVGYPGTKASSLVAADFNGDHHPDIVTVNGFDNTFTVFTGDGKGGLTTPKNPRGVYKAGTSPIQDIVADLNGDGRLDIATLNGEGTVSILNGKGNGAFAAQARYRIFGTNPFEVYSFTAGDLNRDGRPDLVAVGKLFNAIDFSGAVSVLLAKKGGGYQAGVDSPLGMIPSAVAVADLNGDSKLDLAIAGDGANQKQISVLPGNGDGTFQMETVYPVTYARSLVVTDLNKDGHPDLASVGCINSLGLPCAGGWDPSGISVLLGNGTGGFSSGGNFDTPSDGPGLAAADLNGDGRPDLAACNGNGTASVLLGNGDGSLQTHQDFPTGRYCNSIAIADTNDDGRSDLVTSNDGDNTASVLLGVGNGMFLSKQDFGLGHSPSSIAVGDLNSDGKIDLATANGASNTVSVLLNSSLLPNDLSLKVTGPATATVGTPIGYAFTVTNASDLKTTNVRIKATLGNLANYAAPFPSFCNNSAQTLTCSLGTLDPKNSQSFTIEVTPIAAGNLTFKAKAIGKEADPNPANNSAGATITVD